MLKASAPEFVFVTIVGLLGVAMIFFFVFYTDAKAYAVIKSNLDGLSLVDQTHAVLSCLKGDADFVTKASLESLSMEKLKTVCLFGDAGMRIKDLRDGKVYDFGYGAGQSTLKHDIYFVIQNGETRNPGRIYMERE